MKIKSLLIGSAAAIVAAPAAFAADVIIAEPEPVEYVEVCDVAGAGYFYIPGSRTCLQIGGLVRHELGFRQNQAVDRFVLNGDGEVLAVNREFDFQEGWDSLVRAELTARTFSETELGDLTTFIRLRSNDVNDGSLAIVANEETGEQNNLGASVNGSTFVNDATIGLGGLLMGLSDTLYDGGINGEFDSFGGDRVHFIRYTADLGAFSASLSAEVERSFDSRFDFVPNVVGQVSGDVGAFSVDLWAAYDDEDTIDGVVFRRPTLDPVTGTPVLDPITGDPVFADFTGRAVTGDDEFSLKARLGADFGPAEIQVAGTYNSGANYYDNGFEYSIGASAKFGLGEKASITLGGQYFANELGVVVVDTDFGQSISSVTFDENDAYSIGAVVDYEIVDGFDMKVALNYKDDLGDRFIAVDDAADIFDNDIVPLNIDGRFEGFVRFDRSF